MSGDEKCKESYKECMASHAKRYREVIASREPWETLRELAERADCSHDTIQRLLQNERLLQSDAGASNCNMAQGAAQNGAQNAAQPEEYVITDLKAIKARAKRMLILDWIAANWNVQFTCEWSKR